MSDLVVVAPRITRAAADAIRSTAPSLTRGCATILEAWPGLFRATMRAFGGLAAEDLALLAEARCRIPLDHAGVALGAALRLAAEPRAEALAGAMDAMPDWKRACLAFWLDGYAAGDEARRAELVAMLDHTERP